MTNYSTILRFTTRLLITHWGSQQLLITHTVYMWQNKEVRRQRIIHDVMTNYSLTTIRWGSFQVSNLDLYLVTTYSNIIKTVLIYNYLLKYVRGGGTVKSATTFTLPLKLVWKWTNWIRKRENPNGIVNRIGYTSVSSGVVLLCRNISANHSICRSAFPFVKKASIPSRYWLLGVTLAKLKEHSSTHTVRTVFPKRAAKKPDTT
jgi:hypothetical protein